MAQTNGVHIAVLAIAATRAGDHIAISIGTRETGDTAKWFVSLLDRERLEDFLRKPDGHAPTLFDLPAGQSVNLGSWFDLSTKVGVSDGKGSDVVDRIGESNGAPPRTQLWIDRVIRLHFFDKSALFSPGMDVLPSPIARLDTAAFVNDDLDQAGETWAVSRIMLQSALPWPAKPADISAPVEIEAFEITAHIPLVVNAHEDGHDAPSKAKKFDTRAIFKASAKRALAPLWFDEAKRGPAFSALSLGFSDKDGVASKSLGPKPKLPFSLFQLAEQDRAFCSTRALNRESPLFAHLAPFWSKRPSIFPKGTREVGFRKIRSDLGLPQLLLRAEMNLVVDDERHWKPLWDGFAKPVSGLNIPKSLLISDEEPCLLLAQEQIYADLRADIGPIAETEWLLTARVEQSKDTTSSIETEAVAAILQVEKIANQQLRQLRPETGMSVVPAPKIDPRKALPWHMVGRLRGPSHYRTVYIDGQPAWEKARQPGVHLEKHSFEPRGHMDLWRLAPAKIEAALSLSFHTVTRTNGTALEVKNPKLRASDLGDDGANQPPKRGSHGLWFEIGGAIPASSANQKLRFGAFEFELETGAEVHHPPRPPFRQRFTLECTDGGPTPQRLDIKTMLEVRSIAPVEQDPLRRDQMALGSEFEARGAATAPLLIPLSAPFEGQFQLIGEEIFGNDRDQGSRWDLYGDTIASNGKLLVIDPQPFRVAAIEYAARPASDSSNQIAAFQKGDDGVAAWRVRDPDQIVRLLLPPQIIGEAMEKNAAGSQMAGNAKGEDIEPGKPAAARFGSLTRVDLDPTYRATASREAGWNLRRILNRIGDAAPGALIRDLRFEAAYGMTVRHVPQRETWLAEMGGIIGAAPQRLESRSAGLAYIDRVNRVLLSQVSRLAVDKVWSGRPEDRFETSEDLVFTLRHKDDASEQGPETRFRFPAISGYPSPVDDAAVDRLLAETFDDDVSGTTAFPGGIPWAFESGNILREVYANPFSSSGRIGDVHFSALGGWASQRAEFAHGKSIVETETAMGRMGYYKLERLGRIGGLGNHAKHVIVYRRTVVPSAQFYNEEPIGKLQDEHLGRPILRKVEEYVDILQPERRYPEHGTPSSDPGAILGYHFVSRRIPVNSDWGGDVRNEGWKVPLWREDFAQLAEAKGKRLDPDSPANIYKKPLIQQIVATDDGEAMVELARPQEVYFYTSTTDGETADNIDRWHDVERCDFCNALAPHVHESSPPRSGDLHDGMLPGAPRDAGGHRDLTFSLVDSQVAARLGAGRVEKGPAGVLKNVTLSRSRPIDIDSGDDDRLKAGRAAGAEAQRLAADVRGRLDRLFGRVTGRFEALGRDIASGKERAEAAVERCREEMKAELEAIYDELDERSKHLAAEISKAQLAPKALINRLSGEARQKLQAERVRLWDQADTSISQAVILVLDQADALTGPRLRELEGLIERLASLEIGNPVNKIQDEVAAAIKATTESATQLIEKAAEDADKELQSGFRYLRINLDAIQRAFDQGPDALVASELEGELNIIKQKADALAASIDLWVLDTDEKVKSARAEFEQFIPQAEAAVEKALHSLDKMARQPTLAPGLRACARRAYGAVREARAAFPALKALVDDIVLDPADLASLKSGLKQAVADTSSKIATGATELGAALISDAFNSAKTAFDVFRTRLEQSKPEELFRDVLKEATASTVTAVKDFESSAQAFLAEAGDATQQSVDLARMLALQIRNDLCATLRALRQDLTFKIGVTKGRITQFGLKLRNQLEAENGDLETKIEEAVTAISTTLEATLPPLSSIGDQLNDHLLDVTAGAATVRDRVSHQIDEIADALLLLIKNISGDIDAVRRAIETELEIQARRITARVDAVLEDVQQQIGRQLSSFPGDVVDGVVVAANAGRYLYQEGDNVLRLIRAVGDPPKTDALGCNRPELAYVFDLIKPVVDVTPALALANRVANTAEAAGQAAQAVGDLLDSFGVRLPLKGLGEDLIPDALKDLSLSKLFPDMAGINLEGLLRKAGFPDLSKQDSQGVKITRGFDKAKREAWLQADIDVQLSKSEAILDFGPIALMIDQGHFRAQTRMALAANGEVHKEAKGQIAGDWRVVTAGMDIITFEKTPLLFDKSGKVDFKISSDRVRLAPSLEFLTNLMAKIGKAVPPGVEPVMHNGMPAGLLARLSMALPPVQTGAFAVTDLSLGATFGIIAIPEFEITTSLDIASRDAPFTLAVWLLNGGGYITQRLSYMPMAKPTPVLTYTLDIAIVAGVGIGFGFGVVSGGVWLQVGCSVALTWTTGGGGNVTTVTAFLLARGNVDVAGLVNANIMLRLEISYDGSVMLARGTLRLSFRISMFYTLRVSQGVEYKLLGERRPASQSSSNYSSSFG